ncbi:MAG TPA: shikimate dehydrogenase [Acidimicrobiales bacterium]|jgi:shikimate dehydrogenase
MATPIQAMRDAAGPGAVLVGVIGSPVAHSLSPELHQAAFRALGLSDWQSFAYEIPPGRAGEALDEVRSARLRGISVTMPHKADVAGLVDECSDVARRLDAVNCVVNRDGVLFGTNTDGQGFVASLERGAGFSVAGRRCLVIGAGGAARAVVLALADAGASEVAVMNRTESRAEEAAALAGSMGRVAEMGDDSAVAAADLVVNATPVGMTDGGGDGNGESWLVSPDSLHPSQVAADLVYVPRPTPWLAAVSARGVTTVDGLGMLVHQAAAQIELWTGQPAPVAAMWESVTAS